MLCFKCGVWGHEQQDCSLETVMIRGEDGHLVPKYGMWLKDEEAMPNCFLAFQQCRMQGAVEINVEEDGEAMVENIGDGGEAVKLSGGKPEVVPGMIPVVAKMVVHDVIVGGGRGGTSSDIRGTMIQENREAVDVNVMMGQRGVSKIVDNSVGLENYGPVELGPNKETLDKGSQAEHLFGGPTSIEFINLINNALDTNENEKKKKKKKNDEHDSKEEKARERRFLEKGKQIVGDENANGVDGDFGAGSGTAWVASSKSIGQRKKVSIKDKARHKSRLSAANNSNASVGDTMVMENQCEKLRQLGENGRFVFNVGIGMAAASTTKIGLSGGLLLMWREDLNVNVISSSPGHIVAQVAGKDFLPWTLTGFYGHPEASQRHFSWQLLRDICKETHGAWLCIGDFNEIVSLAEKSGGRVRRTSAMDEFKKVLDDCQLIDFCSVKTDFTWCNEHETDQVMERLDRGLCNMQWQQQFEGADVQLLDWWESDHRALVVDIPIRNGEDRSAHVKRVSRFHFEESWCEEEECRDIISEHWNEERAVASISNF
ncbi:hypothetical protein F8388_016621 [Cannabis sativa]|uniref:CCHC-type domain-containing protein n=1 Tax=Cannabis sativa TaxID=3483 RepID=A0A7J6FB33_CANSA|nr:hypothetical protein F8388_016621 [Cannabis sativa]